MIAKLIKTKRSLYSPLPLPFFKRLIVNYKETFSVLPIVEALDKHRSLITPFIP